MSSEVESKIKAVASVASKEAIEDPEFWWDKLKELFPKDNYYYLVTLKGEQDVGVSLKIVQVNRFALRLLTGIKFWGLGILRKVYQKDNIVMSVGIVGVRPYDLELNIKEGWNPAIICNITF